MNHDVLCICLACRNARIVAHGRETGAIAPENAKLPSFELKACLKLARLVGSSADAITEMATRLLARNEQLWTDDAMRLHVIGGRLRDVATALEELGAR